MLAAGCADWREVPEGASRPGDILERIKPSLTPHCFRHNYDTLLYESGVDPLIAMKIVGHTDYQTTPRFHLAELCYENCTWNRYATDIPVPVS